MGRRKAEGGLDYFLERRCEYRAEQMKVLALLDLPKSASWR
jgi:hypothetical protein